MINRELIRTKVVQMTYAYYQNNKNMDSAEKELLLSLSKAYDLYLYLLQLIVAVTEEERRRLEIVSRRMEREDQALPSSRFCDNSFVMQLEDNAELRALCEEKHINWADNVEYLRMICTRIENSDIYKDYMATGESSYEADREVWRRLYKHVIMDDDDLRGVLEDKCIYWNDDKEIIDSFVLKTIKRFSPVNEAQQELMPEYLPDEDGTDFALRLFRAAVINAEEYQHYMSDTSRNWDFSRLAFMDIVIMQVAIAEMMSMPGVPVSVTINEYVNIAKRYSTPKSSGYVNGMLDTIARSLVEKGILLKPMAERVKDNQNKQ